MESTCHLQTQLATSDASGHWGCGLAAPFLQQAQFRWPPAWAYYIQRTGANCGDLRCLGTLVEGHAEPFAASATMQQLCPLSDQDPQRTRWRSILCDAYSSSLLCISWFSTLVFAGYIRRIQLPIIGHVTVSLPSSSWFPIPAPNQQFCPTG